MTCIDLFSGIGGFALGAYWAGMHFENHYFSEVDPYCVELYQKRFPDAVPLGDITKHEEWDIEPGEYIVTGGFPCTDTSGAGNKKGIFGPQSSLWFAMRDIIGKIRPVYAIIENVAELSIRGLPDVLSSLASIGYDAEWQDIHATDVGGAHGRARLWILAYPHSSRREECRRPKPKQQCASWNESIRFCSIPNGRPTWTEIESKIEPVVARLPGMVDELRAVGKSIVPQIAEMLFRQIKSQL